MKFNQKHQIMFNLVHSFEESLSKFFKGNITIFDSIPALKPSQQDLILNDPDLISIGYFHSRLFDDEAMQAKILPSIIENDSWIAQCFFENKNLINSNKELYYKTISNFKNKETWLDVKSYICSHLIVDSSKYSQLSEKYKKDIDIIASLLINKKPSLNLLDNETINSLCEDEQNVLFLLKLNPLNYQFLNEKIKQKPKVWELATKLDARNTKWIPLKVKEKKHLELLKINLKSAIYLNTYVKSNILMELVKEYPCIINELDNYKDDTNFIINCANMLPRADKDILFKSLSPSLQKNDAFCLQYFTHTYSEGQLINKECFFLMSYSFRNQPYMIWALGNKLFNMFEYFNPLLKKDNDFVLKSIDNHHEVFPYIASSSPLFENREFVINFIKHPAYQFKYLPPSMRQDYEIIQLSLKKQKNKKEIYEHISLNGFEYHMQCFEQQQEIKDIDQWANVFLDKVKLKLQLSKKLNKPVNNIVKKIKI